MGDRRGWGGRWVGKGIWQEKEKQANIWMCNSYIVYMPTSCIIQITHRHTHIYIYICIFICIYTYMYIHIYMCVYVYMSVYMFVYVYTYADTHTHIYTQTQTHLYIYIHMYIYIYVYTYMYVYICIHVCICVCICIYVCMYVSIYVPIYISIYICMHIYIYEHTYRLRQWYRPHKFLWSILLENSWGRTSQDVCVCVYTCHGIWGVSFTKEPWFNQESLLVNGQFLLLESMHNQSSWHVCEVECGLLWWWPLVTYLDFQLIADEAVERCWALEICPYSNFFLRRSLLQHVPRRYRRRHTNTR